MKSVIFSIVSILTVAASAHASQPLLVKQTGPNFVPAGYDVSSKCTVFADKIEVVNKAGSFTATSLTNIQTQMGNINSLISEAAAAKIYSEQSEMPDSGMLSYKAIAADGKAVVLKSAGAQNQANGSPAASTLVGLLDALCK